MLCLSLFPLIVVSMLLQPVSRKVPTVGIYFLILFLHGRLTNWKYTTDHLAYFLQAINHPTIELSSGSEF